MPPVACSGCGSDGVQMLFRSPTIPLEPWLHSPTRPPMSPMPGTWQTPPGTAGVMLAAWLAWTAVARVAWGAWTAWVAASAGVENASNATASSSTRMTQREISRPGEAQSARSRPGAAAPSASGEAGEVAIVRELLVLRSRGGFRRSRAGRRRAWPPGVFARWRLVRAGIPACGRAGPDPGGVGVDPVLQFLRDQVDPDPPGAVG